jgi:hypothetical protein
MSPHLHYETARASRREISSRTINAHHSQDVRGITRPRRTVRQSLVRAVAALGVCLAATAAITDSGAHANPRAVMAAGRASVRQPAREIAALEAKGYAQAACTLSGTLMTNYRTGRSVIVRS